MKKSRIFITSLLLSLPFWWGINVFGIGAETYFLDKEITKDPRILKAQISSHFAFFKASARPQIQAKAAISILIKPSGEREILFSKNAEEKLPIASLTKLMSALIVLNNLDLSKIIVVSEKSLFEDKSEFLPGETFVVKNLLYSSIVESNNEGITILTQPFGYDSFVNLMNMEAKYLKMESTRFFNPTGLDPEEPEGGVNYSTASDIALLMEKIFKDSFAREMLSSKEYDLYDASGALDHKSHTTNDILSLGVNFKNFRTIGGKTGQTAMAKQCLAIMVENSKGEKIINVILGSDDRFKEMKNLADWASETAGYKRILSTMY